MKFKAGWYYVGDPCYAVRDEDWDEFCGKIEHDDHGDVNEFEFQGHDVWCVTVPENEFRDQEGRKYQCDSVTFGVVPMELVAPESGEEATHPQAVTGGQVIEFKKDFVTACEGNYMYIGHLEIPIEEEDDSWGTDDEDDYGHWMDDEDEEEDES